MESGNLKAIIARAVDFYGPGVTEKSAPGLLVFTNMRKGEEGAMVHQSQCSPLLQLHARCRKSTVHAGENTGCNGPGLAPAIR